MGGGYLLCCLFCLTETKQVADAKIYRSGVGSSNVSFCQAETLISVEVTNWDFCPPPPLLQKCKFLPGHKLMLLTWVDPLRSCVIAVYYTQYTTNTTQCVVCEDQLIYESLTAGSCARGFFAEAQSEFSNLDLPSSRKWLLWQGWQKCKCLSHTNTIKRYVLMLASVIMSSQQWWNSESGLPILKTNIATKDAIANLRLSHSLIISREGLILALSILPCPQGMVEIKVVHVIFRL